MAGSLNKVMLIGNLAKDVEVRTTQDGRRVANLVVATNETWKDKNTNEKKEKSEFHKVVIFADGLIGIAEKYAKKGGKVFVEGKLTNRKYTNKEGKEVYTTEVVLQGYDANFTLLDKKEGESQSEFAKAAKEREAISQGFTDDEIPF